MDEPWVDRERRTSRLIRACYEAYIRQEEIATAELIYALCRLTWITKANGEIADNTAAVIAPALSIFVGADLDATTPAELARALRDVDAPENIISLAARPVGMVNYYSGFRNIARTWLGVHEQAVSRIVRMVADANDDVTVRSACEAIDDLPPLPRPGAGDGKPSNLLTPLLACLDRRGRAPISNGRKVWLLRKLRLASSSVAEQYDGLVGLIGQAGITDAFDLDQADEEQIDQAMKKAASHAKTAVGSARQLAERHDEDLEYLRAVDAVTMRRLHNAMTNALRGICRAGGLTIEEGCKQTCLYDALIREYLGAERHLLVEVKTDPAAPLCRMAVGQLLDYRRRLSDRAAIDLAVLLPDEPPDDAKQFFQYVGVKVMWLDEAMKRLRGQVKLAPNQS